MRIARASCDRALLSAPSTPHHDKLADDNTVSELMPLAIMDVVDLRDPVVGDIHAQSLPKAIITKDLTSNYSVVAVQFRRHVLMRRSGKAGRRHAGLQ